MANRSVQTITEGARPGPRHRRPQLRSRHRRGHPGLHEMLTRPRFEVLPLPGITDEVITELPVDATVTVTASPRQGIDATVEVATRLAARGRRVVPHLSARLIKDSKQLKQIVADLVAAGIDEVFVIGGDPATPVGDFDNALELMTAIRGTGHDLRLGIGGYPETHPRIADDVTVQAMWDKRLGAAYIVSQLCFDPKLLMAWVQRVRRRGVSLPIHIGVAGPVNTARLLKIGTRIGAGGSARMLSQHTGLLRLAKPGSWHPDTLLGALEPAFADPINGPAGVHIYTFNAVHAAEQWRQQALQRNGDHSP